MQCARAVAVFALLAVVSACDAPDLPPDGEGAGAPWPVSAVPGDTLRSADSAAAAAAFEQLKRLEGRWTGVHDGAEAIATYSVIGEGSAVLEQLTVNDPQHMATVYYLNDARLVADHYCIAGNQPRIYLDSRSRPGTLSFSLAAVTGAHGAQDPHMHGGTIEIGDTSITASWVAYRNGRPAGTRIIELNRVH